MVLVDHQMKAAFLQSFKARMGVVAPTVQNIDLSLHLSVVDNLDSLVQPFTVDEIEWVVKRLKSDKAPGPDGFNGLFVKKCWHIIKWDFINLCNDFFLWQSFP